MKATNLTMRPLPLDSGTMLAAAGTPGCTKEVAELTEFDRRLVALQLVRVSEESSSAYVAESSVPTVKKERS